MSRPVLFSDKENVLRNVPAKSNGGGPLAQKQDENQALRAKSSLSTNNPNSNRIARVPLGGKNQNTFRPALGRSQSTINSNTIANDGSKTRFRPQLARPPVLSKANSSLGFIPKHNKSIASQASFTDSKPISSDTSSTASAPSTLSVPTLHASSTIHPPPASFSTDNLIKKSPRHLPSLNQTLASTFSSNTATLHASHLPAPSFSVEPVKTKRRPASEFVINKKSTSDRMRRIQQKLREDDYNIEYVPKEESPIPYVPADMEPLNSHDLDFFSKPSMPVVNDPQESVPGLKMPEIQIENNLSFDYDDEHDSRLVMPTNDSSGLEVDTNLGLSTEELHDLLD